jgi:predicted ATPase
VLTRIEIDGFKTFKDFALDVPPFLVVLGQNASGKSNLFDAIAFLARLAGGSSVMQAVVDDRSGLDEIVHHDAAGNPVDVVRFAVELRGAPREGADDGSLRYEIDLRVPTADAADPLGSQSLVVVEERWFRAEPPLEHESPVWTSLDYVPAGETAQDEATSRRYPAGRAFRAAVKLSPDGPVLVAPLNGLIERARSEISAWRVLAPEPSSLRRPDSYDEADHLSSSGAHLPNTLWRIRRRSGTHDRPYGLLTDITNELATVIPEIIDLRVVDVKEIRSRSIALRVRGEGEFTANAASDGTLHALALVTALNDPEDVGLLCVEEPENGVYPQRLHRLVRLLSGATPTGNGRQVLVTSHSPSVLAALPEVKGKPLRDDVVLMAVATRTLQEPRTYRQVSVIRPLRADRDVPLPKDLPGPVMSSGEIEEFLGRGGFS